VRLPKLRQLTQAQKDVYLYAPTDKNVLVHGPPGTGKTLIACLRAIELQKKHVPVVLGMFNQVLAKYSSTGADGVDLPSKTVQAWFRDWWNASRIPVHSATSRLVVEVPYEQKDLAKGAGARWNPDEFKPWGGRKPGAWVVDPETYFARLEDFSAWRIWHAPPSQSGKADAIDWPSVAAHLIESEEEVTDESLDLGCVLIDEGQDFPPAFYKVLRLLTGIGSSRGAASPLRCFVLADENQQLTDQNSTLDEICKELRVETHHRYVLLDNFRNTKEVAEAARRFFADVGVLPNLPKRSGPRPVLAITSGESEIVGRIRTWILNNAGKEAGVLVFNETDRENLTVKIREMCSGIKGREITVQTYSWQSRRQNRAKDLVFDSGDVVTVLNMQSCKGLEFDGVFIVEPHRAQIGLYGPDRFKMQMFVAVSRSREWVGFLDSGPATSEYLKYLPSEEYLEREQPAPAGSVRARADSNPLPARPAGQLETSGSEKAMGWEEQLLQLAKAGKLKIDDKRAKGGAIWVQGGREIGTFLQPNGFQYSDARGAWWRK
jgi:hypothetical protein